MDHIIGLFHLAKAVCGMAEKYAGFFGSKLVAFDVPHIYRVLQLVALGDQADIWPFMKTGITGTGKVCNIGGKPGLFKKQFNITSLTVADDE